MNLYLTLAKLQSLPEQVQEQVRDYIEFLVQKYQTSQEPSDHFLFDWEGQLSIPGKSSVDLQHEANDLR